MASKPNIPKLQHYVPQFLLRNFADENGRVRERTFALSPKGIAAETGFYDFTDDAGELRSLEQFLGEIETRVAGIIAEILKRESLGHLSQDERVQLSLFAAVQQLRVKAVRQRIKSLNEGILRVLAERGIDPGDVVQEMNDDDVKQQSLAQLALARKTGPIIYKKAWVLQQAPEGKYFCISDNPIVFQNLLARNDPCVANVTEFLRLVGRKLF